MARARNIKPGFFANDTLAELDPLTRLLFIGLWTIADRDGRLEDRPKRIKATIFPYDDCNVDLMLAALHKSGFILRYRANDIDAIQVRKWSKHQNPHIKELPSIIPAPCQNDSGLMEGDSGTAVARTPKPEPTVLIPDSGFLIPDPGLLNPDSEGNAPRTRSAGSPTDGQQEESEDPDEPAFISIPLVGKQLHPVTESKVAFYRENFPAVNVEQELRKMVAWCDANPDRRKTKRGIAAFIANWLSKAQDGAGKFPQAPRLTEHQRRQNATAQAIFGSVMQPQPKIIDVGGFDGTENTAPRLG